MNELELSALGAVIAYLHDDERHDFAEQDEEGQTNHVFVSVRLLLEYYERQTGATVG